MQFLWVSILLERQSESPPANPHRWKAFPVYTLPGQVCQKGLLTQARADSHWRKTVCMRGLQSEFCVPEQFEVSQEETPQQQDLRLQSLQHGFSTAVQSRLSQAGDAWRLFSTQMWRQRSVGGWQHQGSARKECHSDEQFCCADGNRWKPLESGRCPSSCYYGTASVYVWCRPWAGTVWPSGDGAGTVWQSGDGAGTVWPSGDEAGTEWRWSWDSLTVWRWSWDSVTVVWRWSWDSVTKWRWNWDSTTEWSWNWDSVTEWRWRWDSLSGEGAGTVWPSRNGGGTVWLNGDGTVTDSVKGDETVWVEMKLGQFEWRWRWDSLSGAGGGTVWRWSWDSLTEWRWSWDSLTEWWRSIEMGQCDWMVEVDPGQSEWWKYICGQVETEMERCDWVTETELGQVEVHSSRWNRWSSVEMVEIDFGHFERWRQSHDSFTEWWRLTSDALNVWRQLGQFQQMVETDLRHFELVETAWTVWLNVGDRPQTLWMCGDKALTVWMVEMDLRHFEHVETKIRQFEWWRHTSDTSNMWRQRLDSLNGGDRPQTLWTYVETKLGQFDWMQNGRDGA